MKTEQQIKSRIREINREDKKLSKQEIKFIESGNDYHATLISMQRSGLFQEQCVLKWILSESEITLDKITHNAIMKQMGTINIMRNGRIKTLKVKRNKKFRIVDGGTKL